MTYPTDALLTEAHKLVGHLSSYATQKNGLYARAERCLAEMAAALRRERERTIAIAGPCRCGIGYIEIPDSIDSGSTFRCIQCQEPIVFDVASPAARGEMFSRLTPPAQRQEE